MSLLLILVFFGGALFIEAPVHARQLDSLVPRKHHEWGSFELGAIKKVRVETENFEKGKLVSTTSSEITTQLLEVDNFSVTLRIEVSLEINGKRYPTEPKTNKLDYSVGLRGNNGKIEILGNKILVIDGENILTEVRQVTFQKDSQAWVSKAYYSDKVEPYVLRRKTTSNEAKSETIVEVITLDMPWKVRNRIQNASIVKTTHKTPIGKTITIETRCEEVPGGVVNHASKEFDANGELVRRTTLELISFDGKKKRLKLHPQEPQTSFFSPISKPPQAHLALAGREQVVELILEQLGCVRQNIR